MHRTSALARSVLFQTRSGGLPWAERIQLSYNRARAVVEAYNLTADDILNVSQDYWEFHTDPILLMDGGMGTLLTIHYNLCAGTLAMFAAGRPYISQTLQELLSFRVSGQYCLTELGHGLDAINLETTATLLSGGEFELHTPVERAAKFMPPTVPCGIPCVSIVFARLIVTGEDRGVKPFLVPLHDGKEMYKGIVCKPLSPRGGSSPVNHALTCFHHVRLPGAALLGDEVTATDPREAFFYNISRVISGTLSMGAMGLSAMQIACYVAGRYSVRRRVMNGSTGLGRPIASFSTQYIPILTALAQVFVLRAFAEDSHARFVDAHTNLAMKHFVAAVFKTTVMKHTHTTLLSLGDRCGAQGLFEVNQLSVMHADMRGAAIAEGDTLGISIRFAFDVLLGRIILPSSTSPDSLLSKHEASLISELREIMKQFSGHRGVQMESVLLPHCQALLEAIGHRFAYDVGVERGIDGPLLDLYVASIMTLDPAWYVENAGISRWKQSMILLEAAIPLYPRLDDFLARLDVESYVTAPMICDHRWDEYVQSLNALGESKLGSMNSPHSAIPYGTRVPMATQDHTTKSRL